MDFESQYNKRLLWQLMSDNNIFAGIPDTKVEAVKSMFEKEISIVNNEKMSLLEKNKKILVTMNTKLNYLRVTSIKSKPSTKETDLLKERTAVMQSKLEDKKEEFNNLMNTEQPEKIDFADDNEDKPIGSEMDQLLANMMENRKQQLNQVMQKQDTNAAEKWIGNDGSGQDVKFTPPTLTIGDPVPTTPSISVLDKKDPEKHVSFSITEKESSDSSESSDLSAVTNDKLNLFDFLMSNTHEKDENNLATTNTAPFIIDEDDMKESSKADAKAFIIAAISRIESEMTEIRTRLEEW